MKEKNKKRSWKQIVSILSCIVVFCTTYALILPAVTLSTDTFCGKEEHTHNADCYRSETPLCGLEEGEGSEGHTHTEDCYGNVEVGKNLICGMEEVEGHVHDDSCYQSEFEYGLICGKEESEPIEGHVHNEDCYKSEEPICGKEEHTHSRECYSNKEDVEDPKDWEEAYKDINKEEDAKTRILTVAKNEVGYKENEANFTVDENDAEHYYTRYGHLYEDMYGDWNNYFTGYVLKYANVKMNFDKDISKWQNKTIDDQKEEGEEGNVVFFRDDEGELRSGIVTYIDNLKKEIRVIEGDVDGQVKEERVNKDQVIAYLSDEITIEDEDTPLAGGEDQKDDEEPASEKSVDVDGKDQVVEVGDQITLTANENGFENTENLLYQWQYNTSEDCSDDAWTNLEGETNKTLTLEVTEENIDYFWRVEVTEPVSEETEVGEGAVPETAQGKIRHNLTFRWNEGDTSIIDQDPVPVVTNSPTAVSQTFQFKTNARDSSIDWDNITPTAEDKIVVKKIWEKKTPKDATLKVQVRLFEGNRTEANWDSKLNRPILEEDEVDNNHVIEEVSLSADNKWTVEISLSKILNDEKINNDKSKLANIYVTESGNEELLKDYTGWFSAPTINNTSGSGYQLSSTPASTLEDGHQYVILDSTTKYIANDNTVESKNEKLTSSNFDENNISDSQVWIVEKDGNDLYLKNKNNRKYLNVKDSILTDQKKQSYTYSQPNLYYQSNDGEMYLRFKDNKFGFKMNEKDKIKIYEVVEKPASNIIEYVITNSLIGSGTYGDGELKVKPEEIIHSKTIDYLGDDVENKDAGYTEGTNLSDKYRLYLDAGPIAGDKPVDLVLVLDNSSSMGDDTDSNLLKQLKDVLIGTDRSGNSGLIHDFFEMNTKNTVTITEFDATSELKCYKVERTNKETAINQVQGIKKGHGTNYQGALYLAEKQLLQLENDNPDTQKYMIFLSDGDPYGWGEENYNGTGHFNNSYQTAYQTTQAIESIHKNFPDLPISTIAFKEGGTVFLKEGSYSLTVENKNISGVGLPANGGKYCASNNQEQLKNDLRLLAIGPRCTNAVISDTLSQYVDFDWDNIQLRVKAIHNSDSTKDRELLYCESLNKSEVAGKVLAPTNSEGLDNGDPDNNSVNGFYMNDNPTTKLWDIKEIIQGVQINEKTISLQFASTWELDPTYRYEMSFNIIPTQEAYNYLADHNGTYPNTGSQKSDYLTNITSTNQKGFFSNNSSRLKYQYNGTPYSTDPNEGTQINAYQRPVVQVNIAEVEIKKIEANSNPEKTLKGATFEVWRVGTSGDLIEGTNGEKGICITTVTTSDDGTIRIDKRLAINRTYYLKEVKAPDGYYLLNDLIKLEVESNKIWVTISEKDGGSGQREERDIDGNRVIQLTIKNTPGSELPNTGGAGTKLFTFSGAAVIAASGLMYGYKKKKDKRNGKGGLRK